MNLSELKQTRRQIRKGVHAKFIELTMPRVSVDEVAKKLGVSRQVLYNFKNNLEGGISDETVDKLDSLLKEKEKGK